MLKRSGHEEPQLSGVGENSPQPGVAGRPGPAIGPAGKSHGSLRRPRKASELLPCGCVARLRTAIRKEAKGVAPRAVSDMLQAAIPTEAPRSEEHTSELQSLMRNS